MLILLVLNMALLSGDFSLSLCFQNFTKANFKEHLSGKVLHQRLQNKILALSFNLYQKFPRNKSIFTFFPTQRQFTFEESIFLHTLVKFYLICHISKNIFSCMPARLKNLSNLSYKQEYFFMHSVTSSSSKKFTIFLPMNVLSHFTWVLLLR